MLTKLNLILKKFLKIHPTRQPSRLYLQNTQQMHSPRPSASDPPFLLTPKQGLGCKILYSLNKHLLSLAPTPQVLSFH